MAHFTYAEKDTFLSTSLCQGDIIKRTESVDKLIETIHPYYDDSNKYPFFMILTQSCDLIRRDDKNCKSKYITLAAVRPLEVAIERHISEYQKKEFEKSFAYCNEKHKENIRQFLERLFNNNEPNLFYLREEASKELFKDYCAFLHLTVAVKSNLNYDTLLEGKVIQLEESFQHKLGYLTGQIYSRIGTQDWDEESLKALIKKCFKDNVDNALKWLPNSVHKKSIEKISKTQSQLNEESVQEIIQEIIQSERLEARREKMLEIISSKLSNEQVEWSKIKQINIQLKNDPEFNSRIK